LLDQAGHTTVNVAYNDKIVLRMAVEVCVDIPGELAFGYHIRDNNGVDIVYSDSLIEHAKLIDVRAGQRFVIDWAFQTALQQGAYTVAVVLSIPLNIDQAQVDFCDFIPVAVQFNVERRQESRLYGAVHWDNVVSIEQYDR
jgi:lipopolysaccharide transport system ATP-binding protein